MIDSLDRFVEFDNPGGCQLLYIEHSHQRRDVDLIEYCWKYHLCIAEYLGNIILLLCNNI